MNFLKRQWLAYRSKSNWSKFTDLLFVAFLIMAITPIGRIWLQKGLLLTGVFGHLETNENQAVSDENWQWSFITPSGEEKQLIDFKGKPIFLNYWATWCPPCNAEMPAIIEMIEELRVQGNEMPILLVTSEPQEKVEAFLTNKGWDIPVVYSNYSPVNELAASSLPTSFVINKQGVVVHRSEGMRSWSVGKLLAMLNP